MTAIAIALGMVALFWMAATNIGADTGSETAEAAPTSGETQRPASESLTDGTPPSASGSTDQSEFLFILQKIQNEWNFASLLLNLV